MRVACVLLALFLLLSGCSDASAELERGMVLRSKILKAQEVSFSVDIAADYGDSMQLFSMACQSNSDGDVAFTVTAPETISGITGTVSRGEGKLTFADTALHISLLTDEQLNPLSAPWILMKTLRSGYLTSAGLDGNQLRLSVDDGYEDNALRLDIWLDENDLPQRAEIFCDGRTILTLSVTEFRIQ